MRDGSGPKVETLSETRRPYRRPLAALRPWTDPMALERQIGKLVWRHPLNGRVRHRVLIPGLDPIRLVSLTTAERGA